MAEARDAAGDLVVVGRVRKAHGVRGDVVVEALTTTPETVLAVGRRLLGGTPDGRPLRTPRELTVRSATPFKGGWIMSLSSIDDRNEADLWRDRTLLVPESELPPPADDEVHYHDLLGLRVELADGTHVGEVVDLFELPQGLAFDVKRAAPAKGTVLLLYRPEVVAEVDLTRRAVVVTPPDGLLE
ncbi:Ribosome maturation factor rimM [Gemmatirosa kalamazoonensis]|uniref:Ribosome maturation factor RimM n=1 Tax=Gemmatirosa kalamazoonensis TaxID=861299 RepID=W0RLN5_9BACT|nr:ribosome maturation factor RimM [Gemmatirosa kalamazoonensis]AHG91362.1 Ribosome maturation factor rimM [Gemmatirosa kalamazoonensis]